VARLVAGTVALAGIGAACGDTARPTSAQGGPALAQQLITGQLAGEVGLGALQAECPDPGPLSVGTTFTCTATTTAQPGDAPIRVHVAVRPDAHLALTTLNLIVPAALPAYRRDAATQLTQAIGTEVAADAVDCGQAALVVPDDGHLVCTVTVAGRAYDLQLVISDVNARRFTAEVADPPRT
jgi:hypothetical protein